MSLRKDMELIWNRLDTQGAHTFAEVMVLHPSPDYALYCLCEGGFAIRTAVGGPHGFTYAATDCPPLSPGAIDLLDWLLEHGPDTGSAYVRDQPGNVSAARRIGPLEKHGLIARLDVGPAGPTHGIRYEVTPKGRDAWSAWMRRRDFARLDPEILAAK